MLREEMDERLVEASWGEWETTGQPTTCGVPEFYLEDEKVLVGQLMQMAMNREPENYNTASC